MPRLNNIIYIRVIATLMVVAYHSLYLYTNRWNYMDAPHITIYEQIAEILNRIDMPAFVFISGYLFSRQISRKKYKSPTEIIWNKINRLLLPYIFWMVINLILVPEPLTFMKIINGFNHLWFLPMLFQMFLITIISIPLWTRLTKQASLLCFTSMLLLFFVAYYKGLNISLGHIKTFLPVFYLGIITEKYNLLQMIQKWHKFSLPISATLYIIACIFLFSKNPAVRDITIKTTAYIVIMSSMSLLIKSKDISHQAIILTDKYSMSIYLIHHILIQYALSFQSIFQFLASHYIIGPILIFAASIICSISIASLLHRTPYLQKVI